MQLYNQISFRQNEKLYNYLKANSHYFKYLNRDTLNFKMFQKDMKIKYKERATDKISNLVDNMDMVSSILNILK